MKKIILTALAIVTIQLAQAQQAPAPAQATAAPVPAKKLTPEQAATRQTERLQKVLTLNEEQKQKVYQASLTRNMAIQQLRDKSIENRKTLRAQARPVKEQFVKDVNATLTPEQQQKWEQYRLEQKQKQEARKNAQTAPAAPAKQLEPHDDGTKD